MKKKMFVPVISFLAAAFFERYLGSEGAAIMTTGRNIALGGIVILGFIFLFHLLCMNLNKRSRFLLVFFFSVRCHF